jgi:hypothetical protein
MASAVSFQSFAVLGLRSIYNSESLDIHINKYANNLDRIGDGTEPNPKTIFKKRDANIKVLILTK